MTVAQLQKMLDAKLVAGAGGLNKKISGFYSGDLLSWVMANAEAQQGWITIQTNINVIAVAVLTKVSCVLVAENADIPEETITKADEENIPILQSSLTAYDISVRCACHFENCSQD